MLEQLRRGRPAGEPGLPEDGHVLGPHPQGHHLAGRGAQDGGVGAGVGRHVAVHGGHAQRAGVDQHHRVGAGGLDHGGEAAPSAGLEGAEEPAALRGAAGGDHLLEAVRQRPVTQQDDERAGRRHLRCWSALYWARASATGPSARTCPPSM